MPLINTSLPNLVQGVSQQPDTMRFEGQCEEQINALSSVSDGLKKRPNTRYVKNLVSSAIADGAFVHFINRDKSERYVTIINNNTIQVFDLVAGGYPVTIGGSSSVSIGSSDYLYLSGSKKPIDYIKALTVGDNTFLLNTDKTVGRLTNTNDKSAALVNKALVFIKQGDFKTRYNITLKEGGNTIKASYSSGDVGGNGATGINSQAGLIAKNLNTALDTALGQVGGHGFTVTDIGTVTHATTGQFIDTDDGGSAATSYEYPLFEISHSNAFEITVSDSKSGTALGVAYKEVGAISDLPKVAPDGFRIKVRGDAEAGEDDYYVKFQTNDGSTSGVSGGGWIEDVGFDEFISLDSATLPQKLVNTGAYTFTLGACTWNTKQVGDDTTNPFPSFYNRSISNLFFYKNRLGFLSKGSVILSEAGEYFNFFRTTVRSLLDADPIDVDVASTKVNKLKSAVGFQENLILFGERGQFVLKGGELLTPKTVSITPITNYETDTSTTPLELGSYIYFPFTRGSFSGVREFSTNINTDSYDSLEITSHVPQYIPSNILDMAGSTTENLICLVSSSDTKSMYVYKYYWSGEQKVLSSWSQFTFPFDIRGFEFVESDLYIVATKNGKTELLVMPMEEKLVDTDATFNTYLDMRQNKSVSGSSTITLGFTPENTDTVQVYTRESGSTKAGALINSTINGNTITVDSAYNNTPVWVGIKYTMSYTFSDQVFKQTANQSRSPSGVARHLLKGGTLFFSDTAAFRVEVTPKARSTYTNPFTSTVVGSTTIGTTPIESGSFSFPIMSAAKDTKIKIVNDSGLPSNFQSAEFESFIHSRSKRV
jgi:hypothetical protein|tara:strand:- start:666 stop:3140 length:2475 start_codon:yes stop_codon:yes gene_type:complete